MCHFPHISIQGEGCLLAVRVHDDRPLVLLTELEIQLLRPA
jgi:hypothetical protein